MKIIQITDHNGGGGVNSFVYDLCMAQKKLGHEIMFLSIIQSKNEATEELNKLKDNGIKVLCLGAKNKRDAIFRCSSRLRKTIKEFSASSPCICNLHLKLSVLMGVLAGVNLKNVKLVETYHNTYHHYHLQCWLCSPFIKKYIAVSETAKEEMHNRFFIPYTKIAAIPNGVSRNRIRDFAEIERYVPKNGRTHIVSVGRLSYEKNFKVPARAFVDLCNEYITYTLVGGGPQEEEIREIVSCNPYIKMTGSLSREQTLHELAKADIVVMPSLWEGRSILQMEALALDKPMILSDVPGLREPFAINALDKNESFRICKFGYLVKTNDYEAYKKVAKLFSESKTTVDYEYISKISKENDLSKVAKKYVSVYLS